MQARLELTPALLADDCDGCAGQGSADDARLFQVLLPCDDDQRPSLLIFVRADGRLSFRCFAGCPTRRMKMALRQRGFDLSRESRMGGYPRGFCQNTRQTPRGNLLLQQSNRHGPQAPRQATPLVLFSRPTREP
jgi:hypothetical protein